MGSKLSVFNMQMKVCSFNVEAIGGGEEARVYFVGRGGGGLPHHSIVSYLRRVSDGLAAAGGEGGGYII